MSPDSPKAEHNVQRFFTWAVPLLWGVALVLPAYSNGTRGFTCLTMGWGALIMGNLKAFLAWLANVPFFLAYRRYVWQKGSLKVTIVIALIAVFLSLTGLLLNDLEENEGGSLHRVTPSYGALLWFGSMVILMFGCIYRYSQEQQKQHPEES